MAWHILKRKVRSEPWLRSSRSARGRAALRTFLEGRTLMKQRRCVALSVCLTVSVSFARALTPQGATLPVPAGVTNPFFAASTLPFQAPPFDKIKDSDYAPAIEEGMKRQLA